MCTLSFIPRKNGYIVAMNRDERLTRVEASVPRIVERDGVRAVYPYEPAGGTWIATNQYAVTFALLNLGDSSGAKMRSRGEIIPALISRPSLAEVEWAIEGIDKHGILPFRLVAISGHDKKIAEWRWQGTRLARSVFDWHARHWFSSGISDERAQALRAPVCHLAWQRRSAGSLPWLRRLHRSHEPERGAFSLCVHRPDAGTRSYTEIVVGRAETRMAYVAGAPCRPEMPPAITNLPLLAPETFRGLIPLMSNGGADARQDRCNDRS